jgi:hypothetical protein
VVIADTFIKTLSHIMQKDSLWPLLLSSHDYFSSDFLYSVCALNNKRIVQNKNPIITSITNGKVENSAQSIIEKENKYLQMISL